MPPRLLIHGITASDVNDSSWSPWFIGVILFTSVVDYWAGRLIEGAATPGRRRAWLWVSIFSNLGFLAFFKYTCFAYDNGAALLH